jgi:hypothetical protein
MRNQDSASLPARPIELFYAYSHKDETLRDKLATHLSILQRNGIISGWHDRKIPAGMQWSARIDERLNAADIILLLVSADFIASNYCYDKEMMRAIERHERGEACVIPVILRPCEWEGALFGKLQGLPRDMKPVTSWASRDEAFKNVVVGIRKVAEELQRSAPQPSISGDGAHGSRRETSGAKGSLGGSAEVAGQHRVKWRPDSNTLWQQGPHIEIVISKAVPELRKLRTTGLDLPELPVRAVIDTGASLTLINPEIAATCKLTRVGQVTINAVGGEAGEFPEYAAAISFPGSQLPSLGTTRVVACPIIRQPFFSCLIGRDILRKWLFTYDGRNGEVEITA